MRGLKGVSHGSLALHFLNTAGDKASARTQARSGAGERLRTAADVRRWLGEHAPLADTHGSPPSAPEGRILLDEALRLRTHIREALEAHRLGRRVPALALLGINRALHASPITRTLELDTDGLALMEHSTGSLPLSSLAAIALDAARLLSTVAPARIRRCASSDCGAWFVDTSKGGRRRWCSMARCGNRAKAATHRRRHAGVDPTS
jgi:predicted RNA-binding Zn ribbon-like protein